MSLKRAIGLIILFLAVVTILSFAVWYYIRPEIQFFIYWVGAIVVGVLLLMGAIVQISGYTLRDLVGRNKHEIAGADVHQGSEDDRRAELTARLAGAVSTQGIFGPSPVGTQEDRRGLQFVVPAWQRVPIAQWDQRLQGFEIIPLEQGARSSSHYQYSDQLGLKPLLGRQEIPFVLRRDASREWIRGVEVWPRTNTDRDRSPEITPGAESVVSAYVLVTAGNAWRTRHGVAWEGRRIGYLIFQFATFSHDVPLILGQNIREWSHRETGDVGVVDTLTDPNAEQVWRSEDDRFTLDMLRVDLLAPFPFGRDNTVLHFQVVGECEGIPSGYPVEGLPHIRVSGLTYRVRSSE